MMAFTSLNMWLLGSSKATGSEYYLHAAQRMMAGLIRQVLLKVYKSLKYLACVHPLSQRCPASCGTFHVTSVLLLSCIRHTRVPGGFASIRSVLSMEHEDHMHSFFLAESCKYLYLMANDSFMQACCQITRIAVAWPLQRLLGVVNGSTEHVCTSNYDLPAMGLNNLWSADSCITI